MRRPTDRLVMHSYPGMVAIVTARWNGRQNAMAAGWHSFLSIEPPLYGVAVARERYTHHLIQRSGVYGVQFLPAKRSDWIQQFGVSSGHETAKLAEMGIEVEDGLTVDVPLLKEAYIAYECQVADVQAYGDHDWFVGRITQFHRDDELFQESGLPDLNRLAIPLYLGRSMYAVLDASVHTKVHFFESDDR